jgi:hypothetical protein
MGTTIASCTDMVVCNATWNETQARGVVAIYVVNPQQDTVNLCSGSPPATRPATLRLVGHKTVSVSVTLSLNPTPVVGPTLSQSL